jgi:hypothetical protein
MFTTSVLFPFIIRDSRWHLSHRHYIFIVIIPLSPSHLSFFNPSAYIGCWWDLRRDFAFLSSHYTCLWSIPGFVLCLDYHFLEPTVRVSPKISSPQPSHIPRLSSQRTTNARLIRDQFIAEFHTSSSDGSFGFQEVPSYLALHNLLLPEISSESDSEPM